MGRVTCHSPTAQCSAPKAHLPYHTLIIVQLQRRLEEVLQRTELLFAEEASSFKSANTRSHDAEFGEITKVMRAASDHAGKDVPLVCHQPRIAVE